MSISSSNPIKIFRDGNLWCALYGEDLQAGIAAFADTPIEALEGLLAQGLPYSACEEEE